MIISAQFITLAIIFVSSYFGDQFFYIKSGSRHNLIIHFIIANKINKLLTKNLLHEIKKDQFYEFYWAFDESI
jgi:hypothetical protein